MSPRELIDIAQRRLRTQRLVNAATFLSTPILVLVAAGLGSNSSQISIWLIIVAVTLGAALVVKFGRHFMGLLNQPTSIEAGSALDSALQSKDRFTTLAAHSWSGPARDTDTEKAPKEVRSEKNDVDVIAVINDQLLRFASRFAPAEHLPLRLDKPSKYSLSCSPAAIAFLVFVILHPTPHVDLQAIENSHLPERVKDALQSLAEQVNDKQDLPPEIKSSVADIADKLLASDTAIDSENLSSQLVAEVTKEIEAIGSELEKENKNTELADTNSSRPKSEQPQNQPPQQPLQQPLQQPAQQPEQPPKADQTKTEQKQGDNSSGESSSESQQPSQKPAEKDGSQEGEKQTTKQGENQKAGQKGQQASQDSQGEQNPQQGGSAKGQQEKEDKKETAGVGEGKSKQGKNSDKEQKSDPQAGSSDSAKDGQAKNQAGNEQKLAQSLEQLNKQIAERKEKQDKDSQSGEQKNQSEGKKNDPNKKQKDGGQDQSAKPQPSQKQSDQQQSDPQQSGQQQQQEQQGDQPGQQEQQSQKPGQNKPEPEKQGQQKQGAAKDESEKISGKEEQQNKTGDNKTQSEQQPKQDNGKQGETNNKPSAPHQQPNSTPPSADQTERGTQMSIEQKGQIQRPQDGPPTGEAKRFDPFAGQGGEPNPGSLKATERVRVPMEDEKISPKLGAEDQKLYQNKKEARAKISVSDVQLKKPESELSKEKQPLPVEYLEMLR